MRIILFVKYNQNDHIKEDEMGRAYSMSGEEECM
jgi:hypothetical protein